MAVTLDRTLLLAAGAAMVVLAGIVLAAGPSRPLYRAFAAVIALRGGTTILPQLSTDPGWARAALEAQPYFALALVPVALYCLYLLRADGADGRGWGWGALAGALVLDLAYLADHSLFHTLASGPAANSALRAGPELQYTAFGPLAALASLVGPILACIGLRLALRYRAEARAPQGTMLLLLASGLMLGALFEGASRLAALSALLDSGLAYPWMPWGWGVAVLPTLALLPALLTAVVLAGGRNLDPRPQRRLEGRMLVLAAFALSSGFLRLVGPSDSDPAGQALVLVLLGAWRLAMPALLAYGLVRETWEATDGTVREGLAWLTVLAIVAGCGAVLGLIASPLVGTPMAVLAGVLGAAAVAALARPLLVTGRAFAHWLMPSSRPGGPLRPSAARPEPPLISLRR